MMSKIRLQGRSLMEGTVILFCLTFTVSVLLCFSISLMPLVYRSTVLPFISEKVKDFSSYISMFASALMLFFFLMCYNALKTGADRYMLKKAQNVCAGTKDIFYYFTPGNFISLFALSFRLMLIRITLFLFCNIPTAICVSLLIYLIKLSFSMAVSAVIATGCTVFLISSFYFYLQLSSSLFLVRYYYIKGEYLNFRHLISSSQNAMHSKIKSLCRLKFSFSGWFMLCLLIFPLGYVWGYYKQTLAAYANEIIKLQ